MRLTPMVLVVLAVVQGGCSSVQWRYPGATIVADESHEGFELVQRGGPADKSGEWGPALTTLRRIDGHSGRVITGSRTLGQMQPQPDFVFGWRGDYVVYDIDAATLVRSADPVSRPGRKLKLPPQLTLLSRYPTPLFHPHSLAAPVELYAADLDSMTARVITVPQAAEQLGVFDDLIVVRDQMSLTAYSLDGQREWRRPTLAGENLAKAAGKPDRAARARVESPFLATTARSDERDIASIVVRDAGTGEVRWRRDFDGLHPEDCLTLGPWVVFLATERASRTLQGQQLTDYRTRWWLWDRDGREAASGSEPAWRAEYALQGGAAATRVNVAFDRDSNGVVIGCGLDAVFLQGDRQIRLAKFPGEPLLLSGRTLVCRGERGHFGILIE